MHRDGFARQLGDIRDDRRPLTGDQHGGCVKIGDGIEGLQPIFAQHSAGNHRVAAPGLEAGQEAREIHADKAGINAPMRSQRTRDININAARLFVGGVRHVFHWRECRVNADREAVGGKIRHGLGGKGRSGGDNHRCQGRFARNHTSAEAGIHEIAPCTVFTEREAVRRSRQ